MATNPRFDSDGAEADSRVGDPDKAAESSEISPASALGDLDLAELRAKFNAYGGAVTQEISANLALEIVLNEVVEQACLATGASGAAIALERDGEWICRASAGSNAPLLGARLDAESGLSGACVISRQVQRCDDTQNDSRVDREVCQNLGISSLIVYPLLLKGQLAGVFELFSMSRSAFRERDERTLEALSQRVLTILEQASNPAPITAEAAAEAQPPVIQTSVIETPALETPVVAADFEAESAAFNSDDSPDYPSSTTPSEEAAPGVVSDGRGIQILTWILGATVLTVAVLLTVIVAQRLVGRNRAAHSAQTRGSVSPNRPLEATTGSGSSDEKTSNPSTNPTAGNPSPARGIPAADSKPLNAASPAPVHHPPPPAGSLLVYEKGKEIFRMPPGAEQKDSGKTTSSGAGDATNAEVSPKTSTQAGGREGIYQLSSEAAQGNLLRRVEPDYPEEARRQQIEGAVVLEVRAGADGTVQQVNRVSGPPLLAEAAITAVKQWRFKPIIVKGEPIETQTKVVLNFKLPH
jgi:TonB family protein